MDFRIAEGWSENAVVIHREDCVYTEKWLIVPEGDIWHGPLTDAAQALTLAGQLSFELIRNCEICRP